MSVVKEHPWLNFIKSLWNFDSEEFPLQPLMRQIRWLNRISLLLGLDLLVLGCFFVPSFLGNLSIVFGLALIGNIILLHKKNFYNFSRFLFLFLSSVYVLFLSFHFGETSHSQNLFFLIFAAIPYLISLHEIWMMFISLSFLAFSIAYLKINNFSNFYVPYSEFSANSVSDFIFIAILFSLPFMNFLQKSINLNCETRMMNYLKILKENEKVYETTESFLKKSHTQIEMLVSLLSHDLVSSISVISLLASRLKKICCFGENSEKQMELLGRIEVNNGHMNQIITHVRKLRSIINGLENISLVPTSLKETFEIVEKIFDIPLSEKNISLEIQKPQNWEDLYVYGNLTALSYEVLANIISNSIKFSYSGQKIQISIEEFEETVAIQIQDQGIGIPEKILENIFIIGKPNSRAGTAGEKGTGLGMPICQYYCHVFGGKIHVSTSCEENRCGTRFTVTLEKCKKNSPERPMEFSCML